MRTVGSHLGRMANRSEVPDKGGGHGRQHTCVSYGARQANSHFSLGEGCRLEDIYIYIYIYISLYLCSSPKPQVAIGLRVLIRNGVALLTMSCCVWDVEKRRGVRPSLVDPNPPPLSGTSERLAMRPRCHPTVRTAPHPNTGEGSIGLGTRSCTANLRGVGF